MAHAGTHANISEYAICYLYYFYLRALKSTTTLECFNISSSSSEDGLIAKQKQWSKEQLLAPKTKAAAVAKPCTTRYTEAAFGFLAAKTASAAAVTHCFRRSPRQCLRGTGFMPELGCWDSMGRRPTFCRAQQPPPLRDASPSSQQPNATKEVQGRAIRERNDKLVKTTD